MIALTLAAADDASGFPARRSAHADGSSPTVNSVRTPTNMMPVGQCITSIPLSSTMPANVAPRPAAASSAVAATARSNPSASALSRYARLVSANGTEVTTAAA